MIVSYNHEDEIQECLNAILASDGNWSAEIIVVDNASSDKTNVQVRQIQRTATARFRIRLIELPTNTGFTRGVNTGLELAEGAFLMLLNPDTRVAPDALTLLMNYLEQHPECGLVAPQLHFPNGEIQASCRHFPRRRDVWWHALGLSYLFPGHPEFNHWKMGDFAHNIDADVDQPQGAALLTHRAAFETVGLLDPHFPMFFSDVDWCYRFRQHGWHIHFFPAARILHLKGTSIYRNRQRMIRTSHLSFSRYFFKHFSGWKNWLPNSLTALLLFLLALVRILLNFLLVNLSRLIPDKVKENSA